MNRKKKRQDIRFVTGCMVSAAVFGAVVGIFLQGISVFLRRAEEEGARTLQNAITRACVQCYAIEGRYPPSVQYLEDAYGIRIDEERYAVFYSGFASNVMPDITVVPLEREGQDAS